MSTFAPAMTLRRQERREHSPGWISWSWTSLAIWRLPTQAGLFHPSWAGTP